MSWGTEMTPEVQKMMGNGGDHVLCTTVYTTGDLVLMGGTKFYPVYAESSWWNTLMRTGFRVSSILEQQ